jgi:sugar-phosphatase
MVLGRAGRVKSQRSRSAAPATLSGVTFDDSLLLPAHAIVFDMDGVLADSGDSVDRSWARWALERDLDPLEVTQWAHGQRSQETVRHYLPESEWARGQQDIDRYEIEDAASVRTIPGAIELTTVVPRDRWAVYTSANIPLATGRLAAARIPEPPILVTADHVTNGKPDPEGYALAIARLGVEPARVAILEDAPAGIAAARGAGAGWVIGVGDLTLPTEATLVVRDLRALRWADGGGLFVEAQGRLR